MQKTRIALVIGGALFAATSVAGAQMRDNIPQGQMPSPGMCRVWLDGVPAGRQPAQTDCVTARRSAPANSRIIYGSQTGATVQGDPRKTTVDGDPRKSGQVIGNGTYDPRRTNDGRYDSRNGQYSITERERIARERERRLAWERERQLSRERERQLSRERERLAKERRKDEKKRDKEWNKSHKKGHGDDDDDDRRGRGSNGQYGRNDERRDRRVDVGTGTVIGDPRQGSARP
jgi:hypothetical protein